jgi:hypothetical protein
MFQLDAMIGKEVVVWPRAGQVFLLCEEQRGAIIPALVQENPADQGSMRLHTAPFVVGELRKAGEAGYAIRYRMPSGRHFLMALNPDVVATVTYSDSSNAVVNSGIILGTS